MGSVDYKRPMAENFDSILFRIPETVMALTLANWMSAADLAPLRTSCRYFYRMVDGAVCLTFPRFCLRCLKQSYANRLLYPTKVTPNSCATHPGEFLCPAEDRDLNEWKRRSKWSCCGQDKHAKGCKIVDHDLDHRAQLHMFDRQRRFFSNSWKEFCEMEKWHRVIAADEEIRRWGPFMTKEVRFDFFSFEVLRARGNATLVGHYHYVPLAEMMQIYQAMGWRKNRLYGVQNPCFKASTAAGTVYFYRDGGMNHTYYWYIVNSEGAIRVIETHYDNYADIVVDTTIHVRAYHFPGFALHPVEYNDPNFRNRRTWLNLPRPANFGIQLQPRYVTELAVSI
jgi:hypothetical protein